MKKYRLLKDIPGIKAGAIFELQSDGRLIQPELSQELRKEAHDDALWVGYSATSMKRHPEILKDWFEEVKDERSYKPTRGDWYDWIDSCGSPYDSLWDGDVEDCARLKIGNVFRTEEEANEAAKWLKARKILFDDTRGFKPDWTNEKERKYSARYNHNAGTLVVADMTVLQASPGPFFSAAEYAKGSIKRHEEEWKIYLGVEEG